MKSTYYLFLAPFLLVLIFFLLPSWYVFNKKILAKNEQMNSVFENWLLMKIRETERAKIALEIHDVFIQRIMNIKKSVEELVSDKQELVNIESNLFETIQIARKISFPLGPAELDKDFISVVQYYCTEILWQHNIIIDGVVFGFKDIVLEESLEINIFRIIQEAITNIIHYSKADTAEVNLLYSHPLVALTISDNGIGIPGNIIHKLNKNVLDIQHMGLQVMKDRVRLFDGSFYISAV